MLLQDSGPRWQKSMQANLSGSETTRPGEGGGANFEPWKYEKKRFVAFGKQEHIQY